MIECKKDKKKPAQIDKPKASKEPMVTSKALKEIMQRRAGIIK